MICKNCGAELENEVGVCSKCGADVNDETITVQDDFNNVDEFYTPDENESPDEFDSQMSRRDKLEEIKERRYQKQKKEQKKRIIAVVVLVAVIIAAAGGVLAWLNYNFGDSVVVEDPQVTAVPVDTLISEPTDEPEETEEEPTQQEVAANPEETADPTDAIATFEPVTGSNSSETSTDQTITQSATVKPTTATKTTTPKPTAKTTATAKPSTSSAVAMGEAIQDKNVELGQVYSQDGSSVDIMSFKMGNETYYANVNKGTTTGQISGVYRNITAHATDKSFNGKPVYEITSMTDAKTTTAAASSSKTSSKATADVSYSGDYVLANSSTEYVTDAQLNALTKGQLSLARNEIYARHGRKFKSSSLQSYFESKSWYSVNSSYNYSNDSANLTQIEKTNLQKIIKVEATK